MKARFEGFSKITQIDLEGFHALLVSRLQSVYPAEMAKFCDQEICTSTVNRANNVAAEALIDQFKIEVNVRHFQNHQNAAQQLRDAYAHELGHIVSSHMHGYNTQHDENWQACMHAMQMPAYVLKPEEKFQYICSCVGKNVHYVNISMHQRISRGQGFYCNKCNHYLRSALG